MKKNTIWEVLLRIVIAAATAALTALGTTSDLICRKFGLKTNPPPQFSMNCRGIVYRSCRLLHRDLELCSSSLTFDKA